MTVHTALSLATDVRILILNLITRMYDLISRTYEIISRTYEIITRTYEIISRTYKITAAIFFLPMSPLGLRTIVANAKKKLCVDNI